MQMRHVGRPGVSQEREDMRFALRQPALFQLIEIKTDPVRCAVHWMDKLQ